MKLQTLEKSFSIVRNGRNITENFHIIYRTYISIFPHFSTVFGFKLKLCSIYGVYIIITISFIQKHRQCTLIWTESWLLPTGAKSCQNYTNLRYIFMFRQGLSAIFLSVFRFSISVKQKYVLCAQFSRSNNKLP